MSDLSEAQDVFEVLKKIIDDGCARSDDTRVFMEAERLGLKPSEDKSRINVLALNYIRGWKSGVGIYLEYRSHDPSGPFQSLPDINKFQLNLVHNSNAVKYHSNYYEG